MMVLYSGTTCPFSHRCRFVLFEKGMDFEIRDVDLFNKPEDIAVMNPYGQVPILVERDLILYESNIINEYIDERFPHPQLMPGDPVDRLPCVTVEPVGELVELLEESYTTRLGHRVRPVEIERLVVGVGDGEDDHGGGVPPAGLIRRAGHDVGDHAASVIGGHRACGGGHWLWAFRSRRVRRFFENRG